MKIKKFNEFFDNEVLKGQHEIDWLRKDISHSFTNKIDYDFKTEDINNLINKITADAHPFLMAFDEANQTESGEMKFKDFKIYLKYDREEKYWNFMAESDKYLIILGIKINSMSSYDAYVYVDDIKSKDIVKTFEEEGATYNDLVDIISDVYVKEAKEYGFGELFGHDKGRYISRNN
jgi:hypothetical protein